MCTILLVLARIRHRAARPALLDMWVLSTGHVDAYISSLKFEFEIQVESPAYV